MTVSNLTQLRLSAREIFDETLQAIDPYDAVRQAITFEGTQITICDTRLDLTNTRKIYSVAIGKAALRMALALEEILGDRLSAGIISTNTAATNERAEPRKDASYRQAGMPALPARHQVFRAGHPLPNEQSLVVAEACFDLLKRANKERGLILFLISGGGSAMLEWPISADITLADLRSANQTLVTSGASITEINTVRRAFSPVKGGRLASFAPRCDQITLIVSDVPTGQEYDVASGPTLAAATNALSAEAIVGRYGLRSVLPEAVLRAIDAEQQTLNPPSNDSTALRKHFVLLDNKSALEAASQAASARGFAAEIATEISDQSIESGCEQLLNRIAQAKRQADSSPGGLCLVSGGEFSCPVRGNGTGGRNLETALRLVCSTNLSVGDSEDFVALCAGSDGIDGNSPAAGAIVDNTTLARAHAVGLDPKEFLNRSDSYSFFVALGDVIATGPTGTNVRDLRILLKAWQ